MKVKVTITEKREDRACFEGHDVGDEFIIDGKTPNTPLCCTAFHTIWPNVLILLHKNDPHSTQYCNCPDPEVMMTFRLENIP